MFDPRELTSHSLCSFYWEICPKLDENGKLKQEMILVWYVLRSLETSQS